MGVHVIYVIFNPPQFALAELEGATERSGHDLLGVRTMR